MNKVPFTGPKDCKIAFVGEAPGAEEDRTGLPFQGQSGDLLTKLMSTAGIIRALTYIGNVADVRPNDKNDFSVWLKLDSKTERATFVSDEYKLHEERLYRDLRECKANVVVALGRIPLYALTRYVAITKRRGSIYYTHPDVTRKIGRQLKVIPTLHPAGVLGDRPFSAGRNYLGRYFILNDLKRVKEESNYPEIAHRPRTIYVKPSYNDMIVYMQSILSEASFTGWAKPRQIDIGFDIETVVNHIQCFALARFPTDVMCFPLLSKGQDYLILPQEAVIWKLLGQILEHPNITIVGQNLMFDMSIIYRHFGIRTWPIDDTMIAQAILAPEFPKGLDFLCSIWTKEPYYKVQGKEYMKGVGKATEDDFWIYNAKDAAVCLEIMPLMLKDLEKQGNLETYERQRNLVRPLLVMQEKGMRFNGKGADAAGNAVATTIKELEVEFSKITGEEVSMTSPQQLMKYFYITKGIKPYLKNRKPTTDVTALKRLAKGTSSRRGLKEAELLLKHRKAIKLKGTYYDMKLDDDGRLRGSAKPVGTKYGRISSSKSIFGTGGNLQNLPPVFHRFVEADEDCILYDMDLKQAENRIVAYLGPDLSMIKAFEDGVDIHTNTAALMFKKPINEVTEEERESGKHANHGLNYGLGYKGFALKYELLEPFAKKIWYGYHRAYPGVHKFHAWVKNQLMKNRTMTTISPFNRKITFFGEWGAELLDEAYSCIPQSTVGEMINWWGLVFIDTTPAMQQVQIINQIHDNILFQIPINLKGAPNGYNAAEYHAECLIRLKESLGQVLTWGERRFRIPVDVKVGYTKGDIVTKAKDGSVKYSMEKLDIGDSVPALAARLREWKIKADARKRAKVG